MTRLQDLPPDQSAALSLLLRQQKSYADVATLLGISEQAVQERAHAALDSLANGSAPPLAAGELTPQQRADIGDYLLGQSQGVAERLRARTCLDTSAPARDWAGAIVGELAPLASAPLPEIPTAPGAAAPASPPPAAEQPPAPAEPPPPRTARSLPSSRLGGALLLTAIITGIIVAIVLATGEGGGGPHNSSTPPASAPGASTTSSTPSATSPGATGATGAATASTGATGTTHAGPSEQARFALLPTDPASKTVGVAVILVEGTQHAFYLAAEKVPPTNGFFYAVWLYNSQNSFEALGKSPPVTADGRMQGGALLPDNAASFHRMIVTRETSNKPPHPGPIILSGSLKLGH